VGWLRWVLVSAEVVDWLRWVLVSAEVVDWLRWVLVSAEVVGWLRWVLVSAEVVGWLRWVWLLGKVLRTLEIMVAVQQALRTVELTAAQRGMVELLGRKSKKALLQTQYYLRDPASRASAVVSMNTALFHAESVLHILCPGMKEIPAVQHAVVTNHTHALMDAIWADMMLSDDSDGESWAGSERSEGSEV